ncbi:hypothetical protein [Tanticharoenia sakaeratensis]|uniref:hypothetical protein n=1 Tax=Tanticharoenia sakaeratensis TaxID=444053 RepID=UPI000662098D|nr:hypothetical protein [Tanticharoenia sakaeratensis]GBQ18785.1 hypothetical protein AA103193_0809 [Tanticharoenia sakaeratensis NBRC 103193]
MMHSVFEPAPADADGVFAVRRPIFDMSREAIEAVLQPDDPGGLSLGFRAAIAVRIAAMSGVGQAATWFNARLEAAGNAEAYRQIADGALPDDGNASVQACVHYVDLVTRTPEAATRALIGKLSSAGLADADIVRLAELVACVHYAVRLSAGVAMMGAGA